MNINIINNRRALHNFFIDNRYEAGLSLEGWEVKSIRENRVQIKDSYIIVKNYELFIVGMHISPSISVSTHIQINPNRTRKLLLKYWEICKLDKKIKQRGQVIIPLKLYFKNNGRIKIEIAQGRGKKLYDKRFFLKEKDYKREMEHYIKCSRYTMSSYKT